MNYKKLGSAFFTLLIIFGLTSCGQKTEKEAGDASEELEAAEPELKEQIEEVVYEIPSPSEIPTLLERTGAEYNGSLINPADKADSYVSTNDKAALNLGVYATDIGYLVSYDKAQDALTYISSSKKLSDNLGVTGAIDSKLLKRFEDNLSRKDSLVILINSTIDKTESYLKDDDRNQLAALVVAGSFVEGLYISTGLVKTYPTDILPEDKRNLVLTPLIDVILKQEQSVKDLSKMIDALDKSGPVAELSTKLKALEADYEKLNIEEQIKNNRADLVLTDATLQEITSKVAEIRSMIVE
ncbi:hypothetical protein LVD15_25950 [Fulvivirga maritima]|uniref:hypothetical protein n=1 Tax=Fulvivirga maritima TaxID=2904247 RepID=UPI001F29B1D0|nr:hypothetical protein [Fulvivirga maritima]UII26697.1 hypothetical protein LVD15_25950 [Fulvivirga maritima]